MVHNVNASRMHGVTITQMVDTRSPVTLQAYPLLL